MTTKEAIDYLIDNGYLAWINNELTILNKLRRELLQAEDINAVAPNRVVGEGGYIPHPDLSDKKAVWYKFIEDAEVPHRLYTNDGKSFTVRQYSPNIADQLIKIIKSCDYSKLVESTKKYYKRNGYRVVISNYFAKEIWKGEYDSFGQVEKKPIRVDGSNPFEI